MRIKTKRWPVDGAVIIEITLILITVLALTLFLKCLQSWTRKTKADYFGDHGFRMKREMLIREDSSKRESIMETTN